MNKIFTLILVLLAIYFNFSWNNPQNNPQNNPRKYPLKSLEYTNTIIDDNVFKLYIADTESKRNEGLSCIHPNELNDDEGMLFIFPSSTEVDFWMKDMNFNLDLLLLDNEKRVLQISQMNHSHPEQVYSSGNNRIRYAIELKESRIADIHALIGKALCWE